MYESIGLDLTRGAHVYSQVRDLQREAGCGLRFADDDSEDKKQRKVVEYAEFLLDPCGWGNVHFSQPMQVGDPEKRVSWGSHSTK